MKVYIVLVDHDQNLRSSRDTVEGVYTNLERAMEVARSWGLGKYEQSYMDPCCIVEYELDKP